MFFLIFVSSLALPSFKTSNEGERANACSNLCLWDGSKNTVINSIILVNQIFYSLSKGLCYYFQLITPRRKDISDVIPLLRGPAATEGLSQRIPQQKKMIKKKSEAPFIEGNYNSSRVRVFQSLRDFESNVISDKKEKTNAITITFQRKISLMFPSRKCLSNSLYLDKSVIKDDYQ